ncbi:MAG: hypothetical protein IJ343_15285 [Clostridia bacterium]|nr:hypothetical protein [Clostridia bacterium]
MNGQARTPADNSGKKPLKEIRIEDVIILALKAPGVRIERAAFLQKELCGHVPQETIDAAIATSPMQAGIALPTVDTIADGVIRFERTCVTGISAALGIPGGLALAATLPADLAQYYAYLLRAAQKLMYLYGFPELGLKEKEHRPDPETISLLLLCLGAMHGADGTHQALRGLARALAAGMEKKLLRRALTKGALSPVVRSVAKWFNARMGRRLFAGFFRKAVPAIGGVIGGGVTFLTFKPSCDKLKASLRDTILSNPDYNPGTDDDVPVYTDELPFAEEDA